MGTVNAHLANCTYCIHRMVTPGDKKRGIREVERCHRTMMYIPGPSEPNRFCADFQQEGHDHDCKSFASSIGNF